MKWVNVSDLVQGAATLVGRNLCGLRANVRSREETGFKGPMYRTLKGAYWAALGDASVGFVKFLYLEWDREEDGNGILLEGRVVDPGYSARSEFMASGWEIAIEAEEEGAGHEGLCAGNSL